MNVAKIFLISALCIFTCIGSDKIKTIYDNDFKNVLTIAQSNNLNIIIDFYTIWCGGCVAYDQNIFSNSSIIDSLRNRFLIIKINAENKKNAFIKQKYGIVGYPQIIVTDSKGNEFGRITSFKAEYLKSPNQFVIDVNKILMGVESLRTLEKDYKKHPNDIELIEKLIDAYERRNRYQEVKRLAMHMVSISNDIKIKSKASYYCAHAILELESDTKELIAISQDTSRIDNDVKVLALNDLKYHFDDLNDRQKTYYYYQKILDLKPSDSYNKMKFAQFLYENDMDKEKAIKLTDEFTQSCSDKDYWGPYLMAYKYGINGIIDEGLHNYEDWIKKYEQIWNTSDLYWPYVHYLDVAIKYDAHLDKALEYAKKAESYGNMWYDKRRTGIVLHKMGENGKAIKIFEEVKQLVGELKQLSEIEELIKECKKQY